jgi:serine/threonine-protein kinase
MADYHRRLLEEQCPSISGLRPDLDNAQATLIDRMLQRQPARRQLNAMEFVAELDDVGGF